MTCDNYPLNAEGALEASLVIRPMDAADLPQIMSIERKSFSAPWTTYMFEEIIASDNAGVLVMEHEGRIVAYVVFYTASVEGHLMNIAVDPSERRKYFATRLLRYALDVVSETHVTEWYLEVRERNRAAQELYRASGFEVIGRRKRYYEDGEDALVMRFLL